MQDFSKIILLLTFINRTKSQRRPNIVLGKLEIFQANPLPPTFDDYAYGVHAFTDNDMASCIDIMTK